MQTCSDSISASTMARKEGRTRSNDSGKLIPSRRGHESHVAVCGSHSAGMRYPRAAGVCELSSIDVNVQCSTPNVQRGNGYRRFGERERLARRRWRLAIATPLIRCAQRSDLPLSISAMAPKRANEALALPGSSRPVGGDFVLTRPRGCRFVDRADHCPDDNHLNMAADASVKHQSSRNGLDGIKPKAHPDRGKFQQNTEPNSCEYPAACEPTRVNQHERKNNESLSDNDPVKQTSHFTLRPPKIWGFGIKVFQ